MFCPKCGTQVNGEPICPRCGEVLAAENANQQYDNRQPAAPAGVKDEPLTAMRKAIESFFQNYTNFQGRATRAEFWYVYLFNLILGLVAGILIEVPVLGSVISVCYSLYCFAVFIPSLAVAWRRFHDIGKSGAYYFIFLIPIAGIFIFIYLLAKESGPDNQYGPKRN